MFILFLILDAEELSVLLHVCLLNDAAMLICSWVLLGLHKKDNGQ